MPAGNVTFYLLLKLLHVLAVAVLAMFYVTAPYYRVPRRRQGVQEAGIQALARTRPLLAAWIGGVGLVLLITLMVLKPF